MGKMINIITKNELPGVYKLISKTCWISWKNYYPKASIDYAVKNLFCLNRLEKIFSNGQIYGISKDNKIIACGALKVNNKIGILKIIFVDVDFQKCGIGSQIIKFLEDRLVKYGATKSELDSNLSAISFYKKLGYEHKNQVLNYRDGCFVMEKFLA